MTLVYRAVWSDARADVHDVGRAHFTAWVARKEFSGQVPTNGSIRDRHLEVAHRSVEDGTNRADQFSLAEDRSNDRGDFWKTTLTTISEPSKNWVWIDLEWVAEDVYAPRPVWTPPRLVSEMLEAGTASAGSTKLTSASVQIQSGEVGSLVEEIVDPERTVPLVVITLGSSDRLADVRKRSELAARRVAGLARVVYLAGPAIARFNDELGDHLRVLPGGIRTYFPGAGREGDLAGRHRYEPAMRVTRHEKAAADALAELIFPRSASQRPPSVYRQSLRLLFSSRSTADVEAIFDEMAGEIDDLQQRLDRALEDLEVARGQHEAAAKDWDDAVKRVSWLEQLLAEQGDYVRGVSTPDDGQDDVTSLQEVADIVRAKFSHLTFCAGADVDLPRLDAHANAQTWARKALLAFRALEEYSMLKSSGDLDVDFRLANTTSQLGPATIQAGWIAMSESETTNNNPNFRQARTFAVEKSDGLHALIYMPSHIKIAEGGQPCPRIHFHFEDSDGQVRVHIGWFGDHLRNSRTS
jgi:hypothetical protein